MHKYHLVQTDLKNNISILLGKILATSNTSRNQSSDVLESCNVRDGNLCIGLDQREIYEFIRLLFYIKLACFFKENSSKNISIYVSLESFVFLYSCVLLRAPVPVYENTGLRTI